MATEAETARERQKQAEAHTAEHPDAPPADVHMPWFAPLGTAVTDGTLSTESATAIRRGLGEPAIGVTEAMLTDAVVTLIAQCCTGNADQAAKAARHCRDSIDAAGVASRADAMRARQYLRVWDKPDGMLHGNFELDPENGAYFKDFLLQITGPRTGGPRFVEKGEKERAQRIIDDPRSTDQIAAEALIEVIKVAAAADPGTLFGRIRPSVKLVVTEAPATGQIVRTGFIEGSPDAVPTTTIDRSICNGGFIPVLFSRDGTVLDVGREQRPVVEPVETHSGATRGTGAPGRRVQMAGLPPTTQPLRGASPARLGGRRRPHRPRRRHPALRPRPPPPAQRRVADHPNR